MTLNKYQQICIDTLEELAEDNDIEAIAILIEENHDKQKWLDRMAEIVQKGATIAIDDSIAVDTIRNERRRAATKLLRIAKKVTEEKDISKESLAKIRGIK